jgi:putative transposase
MYRWKTLTPEEKKAAVEWRKGLRRPWHSPHHVESGANTYLITAACYQHQPYIGHSTERLTKFTTYWLDVLNSVASSVHAWVVLPNHYHAVVSVSAIKPLLLSLGKLHGRTSHAWNGEEAYRGRQVWYKVLETVLKGEGHFHASINYVRNNAVKHGYVTRWQDWPWSSAVDDLEHMGRGQLESLWREYPVADFGKGWDDAEV